MFETKFTTSKKSVVKPYDEGNSGTGRADPIISKTRPVFFPMIKLSPCSGLGCHSLSSVLAAEFMGEYPTVQEVI